MKKILLIVLMCGLCLGAIAGDYNGDGRVDMLDFAEAANQWCSPRCPYFGIEKLENLARNWTMSTQYKYVVSGDITPDIAGDYIKIEDTILGRSVYKHVTKEGYITSIPVAGFFTVKLSTKLQNVASDPIWTMNVDNDPDDDLSGELTPNSYATGIATVSQVLVIEEPEIVAQSIGGRVRSHRGLGRLNR